MKFGALDFSCKNYVETKTYSDCHVMWTAKLVLLSRNCSQQCRYAQNYREWRPEHRLLCNA